MSLRARNKYFHRTARVLMSAMLFGAVSVGWAAEGQASGRAPVLLELFTSEGCSSCPPADKLLLKLDREQPVNGADLIVLSEHVDYWNQLGWADPYSAPGFSRRQQDYAGKLDSEVYTPQLVIDGRSQVVGSDSRGIENAIRDAVKTPKASLVVDTKRDGKDLEVHVEVGSVRGAARVYLALAADRARSHVMRGENAGRELEHVAVVQSLMKIADVKAGEGLQRDFRVALPAASGSGNLRVVVFAQDAGSNRVVAVGWQKLMGAEGS